MSEYAREIPRSPGWDDTLALAREGYAYVGRRCDDLGTDVFRTRLLLRPALCLRGADAARLFYDPSRFRRADAAPTRLQKTLFGTGGVQALDDDAHHARKALFMEIVRPEAVRDLARITAGEWDAAVSRWEGMDRVVLFDEVRRLLCRAACAWAGVPLPESEVSERTRQLGAMIDGPARFGPYHWYGRWARRRAEGWAKAQVADVRRRRRPEPGPTAVEAIARHRDANGRELPLHDAAVELLNVVRPTVAVARFVTFAAMALHEHPACRRRLQEGPDAGTVRRFVQEVRRYYPFFPFVAARVREPFTWRGYRFPGGVRAILDLYGTDHDRRIWDAPEAFRPERFAEREPGPFELIPQGGGDTAQGHRCPGEGIAVELMTIAVERLTRSMTYRVPDQDLDLPLGTMPTLPRSRFLIAGVRRERESGRPPGSLQIS